MENTPLFETEEINTPELSIRKSRAFLLASWASKRFIVYHLCLLALVVSYGLLLNTRKALLLGLFFLIYNFCLYAYRWWIGIPRSARQQYTKAPVLLNRVVHFAYCDECMQVRDGDNYVTIQYAQFRALRDRYGVLILYLPQNKYVALDKQLLSAEQVAFLKEKIRSNRAKDKRTLQINADFQEETDPLYEAVIRFTWKNYRRFSRVVTVLSYDHPFRKRVVFYAVYCAVVITLMFLINNMPFQWTLVLIGLLLLLLILLLVELLCVAIPFRKQKAANGAARRLSFYEDHFRYKSVGEESVTRYDELAALIETDQLFCLMITSHRGAFLAKEDCSEELIAFLREKKKG